jgi:hypothetical protein
MNKFHLHAARLRRYLFVKEILMETAKNIAMGSTVVRRLRLHWSPRTTKSSVEPDVEPLGRYAFALPRTLLATIGSVQGKHVGEIGPGDHIATGLVLLAAGAASYTCLDRFPGQYSNAYAKGWYRSVRRAWATSFPDLLWPNWLDVETFPEAYPDRVKVFKAGVEDAAVLPVCDVVCSYAVGEHVLDVSAFAKTSRDLLKPGGIALHVVDFSQHFDWSWYGDRFLFLCIPDRIWRWMGSNRGLPNRVLYPDFLESLEAIGLDVETVSRRMADEPPDARLLLPRFRCMSMESIQTLEATFLCTRNA